MGMDTCLTRKSKIKARDKKEREEEGVTVCG